jgi:hypothetical protein
MMEQYCRAGGALFNAGHYAEARVVFAAGAAEAGAESLAGLAHVAAICEQGYPAPRALTHDGEGLALDDLRFPAAAVAAVPVADHAGYDTAVLADAVRYARDDRAADERGPFAGLVVDFVRGEERPLVYRRLAAHVERRQTRERDVAGLFG